MKILEVDYQGFCDWYFDKITIGGVIDSLIVKGQISLEGLANELGYLPVNIVKNQSHIRENDIKDEEIEEPRARGYKIKLIK